jgi:hypothetical protein
MFFYLHLCATKIVLELAVKIGHNKIMIRSVAGVVGHPSHPPQGLELGGHVHVVHPQTEHYNY